MAIVKERISVPAPLAAYFAGFFDGEGSISVTCRPKKSWIRVVLQACQIDPRPLIMLRDKYGGSFSQQPNGVRGQPIWKWAIMGYSVNWALEDMLPYLVVKRDKAELALQVRRLLKNGGKGIRYTASERSAIDAVVIDFRKGVGHGG